MLSPHSVANFKPKSPREFTEVDFVYHGVGHRSHGLFLFLSLGNGPMVPALNAAPPGAEYGDESSLKEDAWKLDLMPRMELPACRND